MNIMEGCSKVNRVGMNKDLNKGDRCREGGLNGKAFQWTKSDEVDDMFNVGEEEKIKSMGG